MTKNISAPLAIVIMLAALTLRLWEVGDRPFHHDESMHALYGYEIATQFKYRYIPFLHGPFLYYMGGLTMALFGDSDFTARLMPALAGTLLCGLPWLLRGTLGVPGALSAMLLLAISPTFLYFSRFLRHDIYSELMHAIMLLAFLKIIQNPKRRWFALLAGAWAIGFANHELAYITSFLLMVYLVWQIVEKRWWGGVKPWIIEHRAQLFTALGVALATTTLLFSSFFTNLQGVLDGLPNPFSKTTSLGYWLSQHGVKRGNQPWFYYLTLLSIYEFVPFFIFGIAACRWRHLSQVPLLKFLLYWGGASLVIYSWAGERMPWLTMHPLLPMILIAGYMVGRWLDSKRWILIMLLLGATGLSGFFSWRLNFRSSHDPREPMVYVQTNADVLHVVSEIQTMKENSTRPLAILIDNEITWPFPWYLRHIKRIGYQDRLAESFKPIDLERHDVLLMHLKSREALPKLPPQWRLHGIYALRSWWVPDRNLYLPNQPGALARSVAWWWNRQVSQGEGDMIFAFFTRG